VIVLDTNVLVFAVHDGVPEQKSCRALVTRMRDGPLPWFTTWGILYEFLRVTTHPRVFRKPWSIQEAWSLVASLLASPSLTVLVETAHHAEVAAAVFDEVPPVRGNVLHDAHTAILMREHGIRRIYTRDMDFHRFPFLEVIDPLQASGQAF